jgi:hypothetical protein
MAGWGRYLWQLQLPTQTSKGEMIGIIQMNKTLKLGWYSTVQQAKICGWVAF